MTTIYLPHKLTYMQINSADKFTLNSDSIQENKYNNDVRFFLFLWLD